MYNTKNLAILGSLILLGGVFLYFHLEIPVFMCWGTVAFIVVLSYLFSEHWTVKHAVLLIIGTWLYYAGFEALAGIMAVLYTGWLLAKLYNIN